MLLFLSFYVITLKVVTNIPLQVVLSTFILVFGNMVKHSLLCLINYELILTRLVCCNKRQMFHTDLDYSVSHFDGFHEFGVHQVPRSCRCSGVWGQWWDFSKRRFGISSSTQLLQRGVYRDVCTVGRDGTRRGVTHWLWPYRSNDGCLDLRGWRWCSEVPRGIRGFCWPTGTETSRQRNGSFHWVLRCGEVWQHWFFHQRKHLGVARGRLSRSWGEIVVILDCIWLHCPNHIPTFLWRRFLGLGTG